MWFLNHYYLELFLLLPSSIFVVFLFKWWFGTYFSNNKKNPPPSPPKLPIIGNLHQIGPLAHRSFKSLAEKYGPVMLLHVGSRPLLVVSSAEAAHQVLIAKDVDFADKSNTMVSTRVYYESKAIAFAPYGEYWRQVRGISVHLILSQTRVQSLRNIREEEMELLIKNIREHIDSSSVIRMDKVLRAFTYEISSRAVIGRRFSDEGGKKFMELLKEVHDLLGVVNIGDYIPWLGWVNHFNGLEAKIRKVEKELDEHLENLIQGEMIRQRSTGSINVDQQRSNQSFLELLIESQKTNPTGDFLGVDAMKAITLVRKLATTILFRLFQY
ncbi:hypothetical protein ACH5RR_039014 [Cinchona calisaya]|uniref:Cytochrome P450 n=1 Tax=Cinchona calisaya TaxID=153742 RepID=A0ABD2XYS1_9GENT